MAKEKREPLIDCGATWGKGFYEREFDHLDDATAHKLLVMLSRIAEKSYRRGFQQGHDMNHPVKVDLGRWRFIKPSLDKSTSPHGLFSSTAMQRLLIEDGSGLRSLGLVRDGGKAEEAPRLPDWLTEGAAS